MYQIRSNKGKYIVRQSYTAAAIAAIRFGSGSAVFTNHNSCVLRIK